jgi:hypothetical protein
VRLLICLTAAARLAAAGADLTAGAGAGPAADSARTDPRGNDARPGIGATLVFTGGFDLLHGKNAAAGVVIPVAIGGSRSSDVFARGGYAGVYTERVKAVLTAGIRVRFAPERRISPWLSFGPGIAVIRRTGSDFQGGQPIASQVGSSRALAITPAAGADIRLNRRWFVRLEMDNYLYRTPATGFVSSFVRWNRWNYNPVVAASIGFDVGAVRTLK